MSDILPSAILAIGTLVWLWRGTDFALHFSPSFPKRQAGRVPSPPRGACWCGANGSGSILTAASCTGTKSRAVGSDHMARRRREFRARQRISIRLSTAPPKSVGRGFPRRTMRHLQHLRTHYYRAILFTFLRGLPLKHGSAKSTCQQPLTTVLNLRVRNG